MKYFLFLYIKIYLIILKFIYLFKKKNLKVKFYFSSFIVLLSEKWKPIASTLILSSLHLSSISLKIWSDLYFLVSLPQSLVPFLRTRHQFSVCWQSTIAPCNDRTPKSIDPVSFVFNLTFIMKFIVCFMIFLRVLSYFFKLIIKVSIWG